jgi:2'-5' RNA ligase
VSVAQEACATISFAVRLFTAIDIPDDVRAVLRGLLARLRPLANLRWTSIENLHITTKFIGDWPEARLGEIQTALRQVVAGPVQIALRGLAWFPNQNRPRVLLAQVDAGPELAALASATERALAAAGVPVEDREYRPHLTLARVKDRVQLEALRPAVEQVGALGSFRATAQYLYLSAGGKYTKLGSFALL